MSSQDSHPPQTTGLMTPQRMTINRSAAHLIVGQTVQLQAAITDIAGTVLTPQQPFAFVSRSPDAVTVDQSGLVKAIAGGSSLVEVSYGGLSAECLVFVVPPAREPLTINYRA